MKRTIKLILIIAFVSNYYSCIKVQEDPHAYYPEVETVSAIVQPDGSVKVKGRFISKGSIPVKYAGFCLDSIGNPEINDRQKFIETPQEDSFEFTYKYFDKFSTYYFRAWASNDLGYSMGKIIKLDTICAILGDIPCSPKLNTVNIGDGFGFKNIDGTPELTGSFSEWETYVYSGHITIHFTFGTLPKDGIYKTSNYSQVGDDDVYVTLVDGKLSGGSDVYVTQIDVNTLEISICSAPWEFYSTTLFFTTKFRCKIKY